MHDATEHGIDLALLGALGANEKRILSGADGTAGFERDNPNIKARLFLKQILEVLLASEIRLDIFKILVVVQNVNNL